MIRDRHPLLPHLLTILEAARRSVVISRPEAILPLFDTEDAISELVRVAKRAPQTGIRVLMRQYEATLVGGSRFMYAMQRMPTKAECRLLEEHPEWRSETMVLVDEEVGLIIHSKTRRPLHLNERRQVKTRLTWFDALWDVAHPSSEMRRLR